MTDKEYIENISNLSNEELISDIESFASDTYYYNDLWNACISELKKRLIR